MFLCFTLFCLIASYTFGEMGGNSNWGNSNCEDLNCEISSKSLSIISLVSKLFTPLLYSGIAVFAKNNYLSGAGETDLRRRSQAKNLCPQCVHNSLGGEIPTPLTNFCQFSKIGQKLKSLRSPKHENPQKFRKRLLRILCKMKRQTKTKNQEL